MKKTDPKRLMCYLTVLIVLLVIEIGLIAWVVTQIPYYQV